MNKPILSLLLFLVLLCACFPAIAEQEPFEILRVTQTVIYEYGYSVQSETSVTEYDEKGLVTSAEIISSSTITHYNFFYEYDMRGNPKTVTVVDAEENSTQRTVTHKLETEYNGYEVVSVSGPVIWGLPLYSIIGHFTGYRNATISDSGTVCRNQDGHLVISRTLLADSYGYIEQQWEYDGDHLIREATVDFWYGSEGMRSENYYRSDGLPDSYVEINGAIVTRDEYVYEDGLDADGIPCFIGRVNHTSTAVNDTTSEYIIRGYLFEDGSVETRIQKSDDNGFIYLAVNRNDSHGNLVYREYIIDTSPVKTRTVITAEYEYR